MMKGTAMDSAADPNSSENVWTVYGKIICRGGKSPWRKRQLGARRTHKAYTNVMMKGREDHVSGLKVLSIEKGILLRSEL
jgi:hypothetical protein